MSGEKYHLLIQNRSNSPWIFYVYQTDPDVDKEKIFSLAWFASPYKIAPGNDIGFDWVVDYEFVWSHTGRVKPGVRFRAGGSKDCKPSGANHTNFNTPPDGAPDLSEPVKKPEEGVLYIHTGNDVPTNTFAVGIGMSGNGTFVQQAEPNLNYQFIPKPTYWVAAGSKMKVGTILDIQTVTQTAEVDFPRRVYSMVATLTKDNTWKITRENLADIAEGGHSTRTTTTNTRTTTTYCCALI